MAHPAQKLVLEETLEAIDRGVHRVAQLEAHLETVVSEWRMRPVVEALQCLRGVAFKLLPAPFSVSWEIFPVLPILAS